MDNMYRNDIINVIMLKTMCDANRDNDYTFFLYLASILNLVERRKGGCLTENGVNSLKMNVLIYLEKIQTGEPKLSQKELVSFLLNLLNSYYVLILTTKLFKFCKENRSKFLELYELPYNVIDDFEYLGNKAKETIPVIKSVLDIYTKFIEGKYIDLFNEEKTKGFNKHIFDSNPSMTFNIK